jgi:hypothetical protein
MGKGQTDKKGNLAQEPRSPRPAKEGNDRGGQPPRRDQLDDQGRQRHIGHGDEKTEPGRRRFEEGEDEGLGRPVRVDEGDERPSDRREWDDKQEGTSRPAEPGR